MQSSSTYQEQSWVKKLWIPSFIPVATNSRSRSDLVERGFSRQPLRVDVDIARSLEALSHAAWSVPKDKYYDGGDRYRSLNRVRAEIVEGGVKVWLSEESTPYVQLKKYNTTIGSQPREYAPLPPAIAGSIGVRKMIAHHLHYLPLSTVGTKYLVNVHLIRFTAAPGRPCDTSPPGLHKDGEKLPGSKRSLPNCHNPLYGRATCSEAHCSVTIMMRAQR